MADKIIQFTNKHRRKWAAALLMVFSCVLIILATEETNANEDLEPSPNIQNGILLEVKRSTDADWSKKIVICRGEKFKLKTSLDKTGSTQFTYSFSEGDVGILSSNYANAVFVDSPEDGAGDEYEFDFTDADFAIFGDGNSITIEAEVEVHDGRKDTAVIQVLKNEVAMQAEKFLCKGEAFFVNLIWCEGANIDDYSVVAKNDGTQNSVEVSAGDDPGEFIITCEEVSTVAEDKTIQLIGPNGVLQECKITVVGIEMLPPVKDCIKVSEQITLEAVLVPAGAQMPKGKKPEWSVIANKGNFNKKNELIVKWIAPPAVNVCEKFTFKVKLCEDEDEDDIIVIEHDEYILKTTKKFTWGSTIETCVYKLDKTDCDYKPYGGNFAWTATDNSSGTQEYSDTGEKFTYTPTDDYGTKTIQATVSTSSGSDIDISTEIVSDNPEECKKEFYHNISSYQTEGKKDFVKLKFYPPSDSAGEITVTSEVTSEEKNFRPYFKVYDDKNQLIIDRSQDSNGSDKPSDDNVPGDARPLWRYDVNNPLPDHLKIVVLNASNKRWDIKLFITVKADSPNGAPPTAPSGGWLTTADGNPYPVQTIAHHITAFRAHDFEATTGVSPSASRSVPSPYMSVGSSVYIHKREAVVSHLNSSIAPIKLPVSIGQTYRSFSQMSEYVGSGWTASFDQYFAVKDNGELVFHRGDGRADIYTQTGVTDKDSLNPGPINVPEGFVEKAELGVFRVNRDEEDPCGENDTYTVTLTYRDGSKAKFSGKLGSYIKIESYTDRFDNKIDYVYDKYNLEDNSLPSEDQDLRTTGAIVQNIIDDSGKTYTFQYNKSGNESELKNINDGRDIDFAYNITSSQLKSIEAKGGTESTTITYEYYSGGDPRKFLQHVKTARDINHITINYDSSKDPRSNVPNETASTSYGNNTVSESFTKTGDHEDTNGVTRTYAFGNKKFNLADSCTLKPKNLVTKYTYTDELYIEDVESPEGNKTKTAYEGISGTTDKRKNGLVKSVTVNKGTYNNPTGANLNDLVTSYDYYGETEFFQIQKKTAVDGSETTYLYNNADKTLSQVNAPVQTGTIPGTSQHDNQGRIKQSISVDGATTVYDYFQGGANKGFLEKTTLSYPTKTATGAGQNHTLETVYERDAYGRQTKVTTPQGSESTTTYDIFGQPDISTGFEVVDGKEASKPTVDQDWNADGTLEKTTVTNPIPKNESYTKEIQTITSNFYDDLSRLTSTETPVQTDSGETVYTFDPGKDRLKKIEYPDGNFGINHYDSTSWLEKTQNPLATVRREFNDNAWVTEIHTLYSDESTEFHEQSMELDFAGRLVKGTDEISGNYQINTYNNKSQLENTQAFDYQNNKLADGSFQFHANSDLKQSTDNISSIVSNSTYQYDSNTSNSTVTPPADNPLNYSSESDPIGGHINSEANGIAYKVQKDKFGRVEKGSIGAPGNAASNLTGADIATYSKSNTTTKVERPELPTSPAIEFTPSALGSGGTVKDEINVVNNTDIDEAGNVTSHEEDGNKRKTGFFHDREERVAVTIRENQATKVTYDDLGRTIRVDYFYGASNVQDAKSLANQSSEVFELFSYDFLSRVQTTRKKDGKTYTFEYYGRNFADKHARDQVDEIKVGQTVLRKFENYNRFGAAEKITEFIQNSSTLSKIVCDLEFYKQLTDKANYGCVKTETTTLYDLGGTEISASSRAVGYGKDSLGRHKSTTYSGGDVLETSYVNGHLVDSIKRNGNNFLSYGRDGNFFVVNDTTLPNGMVLTNNYLTKRHGLINSITLNNGDTVANYSHEARGLKAGTGQWNNNLTRTYNHDTLRRFSDSVNNVSDKFANDEIPLDNFENQVGLVKLDGKNLRFAYKKSRFKNQIDSFIVEDPSLLSMSGAAFDEGAAREWITMSFNMRDALGVNEKDRGEFNLDFGSAYAAGTGFGWLSENSQPFTLSGTSETGSYAAEYLSYIPTADAADRFIWQLDLPNGNYRVKLAGKYTNDPTPEPILPIQFTVEGQAVSADNFSDTGYKNVTIADSNLTVNPVMTHPQVSNLSTLDVRIPVEAIAKVNFGTADVIDGFIADSGKAYADGGQTYGWLLNGTATDVTANASSQTLAEVDPKNSSYIPLSNNGSNYAWEMDVPNGTYFVQVIAGNADDTNPTTDFNVNVEGKQLLNGWNTAYSTQDKNLFWLESPVVKIEVNDGKLTLTSGTVSAPTPDADTNRNELCQLKVWKYSTGVSAGPREFKLVYDNRGRLVEDQSFIYTWDDFDRITTVTDKNYEVTKTTPEKVHYSYDASDRRIIFDYEAPADPNSNFDSATWNDRRLVYDDIELIEEYDLASNELLVKYFYETGINNPIAIEKKEGGIWTSYTVVTDERGSVMGVADSDQNILEKIHYNATGLAKVYDSAGTFQGHRSSFINFGYTGMYQDPFTGRYHTHYRDYDPITCRWNMEDPAGYADGLNLYGAYFGVDFRDILGLDMGDELLRKYRVKPCIVCHGRYKGTRVEGYGPNDHYIPGVGYISSGDPLDILGNIVAGFYGRLASLPKETGNFGNLVWGAANTVVTGDEDYALDAILDPYFDSQGTYLYFKNKIWDGGNSKNSKMSDVGSTGADVATLISPFVFKKPLSSSPILQKTLFTKPVQKGILALQVKTSTLVNADIAPVVAYVRSIKVLNAKTTPELNPVQLVNVEAKIPQPPLNLKTLKQELGRAGMSIKDYHLEYVPEILDTFGKPVFGLSSTIGDDIMRVNGKPVIHLTNLGLRSEYEAINTIFHEIHHIRSFLKSGVMSNEAHAEAFGVKMLKKFINKHRSIPKK